MNNPFEDENMFKTFIADKLFIDAGEGNTAKSSPTSGSAAAA